MTDKEYAQKQTDLFKECGIPEEFQGAISYQAYEDGHAYGYDEVWIHLQDFVYAIKDPIQKYTKRIQESMVPGLIGDANKLAGIVKKVGGFKV